MASSTRIMSGHMITWLMLVALASAYGPDQAGFGMYHESSNSSSGSSSSSSKNSSGTIETEIKKLVLESSGRFNGSVQFEHHVKAMTFKASPGIIELMVTKQLEVRCGVTQTDEVASLSSIIITHNEKTVASVSKGSAASLASPEPNTTVAGTLTKQGDELGYLTVTFPAPGMHHIGMYECLVHSFDAKGAVHQLEGNLYIGATQAGLIEVLTKHRESFEEQEAKNKEHAKNNEDLLKRIQDEVKKFADLEGKINDLKGANSTQEELEGILEEIERLKNNMNVSQEFKQEIQLLIGEMNATLNLHANTTAGHKLQINQLNIELKSLTTLVNMIQSLQGIIKQNITDLETLVDEYTRLTDTHEEFFQNKLPNLEEQVRKNTEFRERFNASIGHPDNIQKFDHLAANVTMLLNFRNQQLLINKELRDKQANQEIEIQKIVQNIQNLSQNITNIYSLLNIGGNGASSWDDLNKRIDDIVKDVEHNRNFTIRQESLNKANDEMNDLFKLWQQRLMLKLYGKDCDLLNNNGSDCTTGSGGRLDQTISIKLQQPQGGFARAGWAESHARMKTLIESLQAALEESNAQSQAGTCGNNTQAAHILIEMKHAHHAMGQWNGTVGGSGSGSMVKVNGQQLQHGKLHVIDNFIHARFHDHSQQQQGQSGVSGGSMSSGSMSGGSMSTGMSSGSMSTGMSSGSMSTGMSNIQTD